MLDGAAIEKTIPQNEIMTDPIFLFYKTLETDNRIIKSITYGNYSVYSSL